MKIQIRRGMFETNSSSNHSLIITNRQNFECECKKAQSEYEWYTIQFGGVEDQVSTKEDKALMLGGLFDFEVRNYGVLTEEYQIFLKVLQDQNETALLEKIRENSQEYDRCPSEPYCTNYFSEGCLIDCCCSFYSKFTKYFDYGSLTKDTYLYDDIRVVEIHDPDGKEEMIRQIVEENREALYRRLYDFIYGDGVIIAYDTL